MLLCDVNNFIFALEEKEFPNNCTGETVYYSYLQESITKTTSLMVMLLSAILVERMICDRNQNQSFNCNQKRKKVHFSDTIRNRIKDSSLFLTRDLRVQW
jgi:hypothetical protein